MHAAGGAPTHPDDTTLTASPETLRRWRSGPRWYSVIAAMIHDERVEGRRADVARAFGSLLSPTAPGQAHVTLAACGFVPSAVVEPIQLRLAVTGADLFRSAVYLRVASAPGATPTLADVRAAVAAHDIDRSERWVPHVTVGVFTRRVPLTEVHRRLGALTELPPLTVTASVRAMAVDTRSPVGALVAKGAEATRTTPRPD